HRQRQLDLADRTLQPRQVRGVVDQLAVQHGCDFVDAVGKKEATVEDRPLGFREGHIRAVDVSDLFQAVLLSGLRSGCGGPYTQFVWGEEPSRVSFRDGPKGQTRNLEIPGSPLRGAP